MGLYDHYYGGTHRSSWMDGPTESWGTMDTEDLSRMGKGRVVFKVEGISDSRPVWNIVWGNDGQSPQSVLDEGHAQHYYKENSGKFTITAFFDGRNITEQVAGARAPDHGAFDMYARRRHSRLGSGSMGRRAGISDMETDDAVSESNKMDAIRSYCSGLDECSSICCELYTICNSGIQGMPELDRDDINTAYNRIKSLI
jgi:hypothetical protein